MVATDYLHQVCPTEDPTCSGSQYVSPHYLPDGRILFATTRQFNSGAVLLNEGKPEFEGQTEDLNESAFVLHVMNPDGTGLHQITFNQSHDIDATVLENGRVMFSRWDHANGNDGMHLYTANPDGTNVQLLYGFGSHDDRQHQPRAARPPARPGRTAPCEFVQRARDAGGKMLALVRPYHRCRLRRQSRDHQRAALRREQPGQPGHAQQRRLLDHHASPSSRPRENEVLTPVDTTDATCR